MNKEAEIDNELITKAYVDQFHQENERSRQDLGLSFYNEEVDLVKISQDNDFNDNKLSNIISITVNRNPASDNEVSIKKYIEDELDRNTFLRFDQTLENYLKVSVSNDIYNLAKYDNIKMTDTTIIKPPNNGSYSLQNWVLNCNDKNGNGKISNFIKPTKTNSPTGDSGATYLSPFGDSIMYIETSSNNNGDNVFCSFERIDIIQISNITFYYNRFSAGGTKSMGRFGIQLFEEDNTWSTRYNIPKNDQNSDTSTLVGL